MLRRAAAVIAILIFAAIAYLTLAPVLIEPVAWQAKSIAWLPKADAGLT